MHFLLGWPATLKLPSLPPLRSAHVQGATDAAGAPLPASLLGASVTEPIRSFAHNQHRTKTAVVTDTAVYLFHFQQGESMCVGVWRRSPDSLLAEGTNGRALFSPHDDCIAVATTRHVLNVLRMREIAHMDGKQNPGSAVRNAEVCSFPEAEWHDESTLAAPLFHPIHLQLHSRVKLANDYITCACSFGDDIVLGTRGGYLQVVCWDGSAKVCVDALAWATRVVPPPAHAAAPQATPHVDAPPTPHTPADKLSIVQVDTCPPLGLVAFVFSNGSAGVCDTSLLRPTSAGQPAPPAVVAGSGLLLLHGGSRLEEYATRVSFNARYRLLAVGVESGDVLVYRAEAQVPFQPPVPALSRLSYLRRYSITPWGFRGRDVGVVQCMEWSPDGSVIAVGWSGRGLVVWSTGGTRVACTLPMLSPLALSAASMQPPPTPATALPIHPVANHSASEDASHGIHPTHQHSVGPSHVRSGSVSASAPSVAPPSELLGNGVSALAWGSAGTSLLVSTQCNELTHGFGSIKMKSKSWSDVDSDTPQGSTPAPVSVLPSAEARCGCGLVTRLSFVRSCLSANPSQNEQTSLALLGEDRIVLWAGKRSVAGSTASAAAGGGVSESGEMDDELCDDLMHDESANEEDADEPQRKLSERQSRRHANEERFLDSDGDWEHIQFPAVYLAHSWPLHLCAISASGFQIACAGNQGLILYNRAPPMASFTSGVSVAVAPSQRKWRRFGNLNHEAAVRAAGLAWYGEHIVCVASRGQQAMHNVPGRTSQWSPPPAAAAPRTAAADRDPAADTIELLFYPRSHLDNSSLLHTHVLGNAASFHSMDISDHTLMVYLSVGQLLLYKLRAVVQVNPHSVHKHTVSPQAAMAAQLAMAAGGMKPRAASTSVPYSTAPHAHDSMGLHHELRMSMELAYVVDLCAPLAPVRSLSSPMPVSPPQYETASLLAMLSTPPLQCRLWLKSADTLEQADAMTQAAQEQETPTPTVQATPQPASNSTGLDADRVYQVPLFCPNAQHSSGLEALSQATTPNTPAMRRRLSGTPGQMAQAAAVAAAATRKVVQKPTKVLTCVILTATGTLLAVDIGSAMRVPDPSFRSPATPSRTPLTPMMAPASATPVELAWVRIVASDVEQFWLHDMAAADPMHTALQYLHAQRKAANGAHPADPSANATVAPIPKRPIRGFRLFSYGSSGLDVWFRLSGIRASASASPYSCAPPPSFQANTLLDFDPEVYPLGLDSTIGVIVGITKGLRTRAARTGVMHTPAALTPSWIQRGRRLSMADTPSDDQSSPFWGPVVCFRLQTQLQPYLHGVLMHLVTNEHAAPTEAVPGEDSQPTPAAQAQLDYAFQIANACRTHEYFSVALELLLHTALNPPASASFLRSHRAASLGAVVSFLRRFPEFPDVVISVARKNDASSWPRLFGQAGTPAQLFDQCMQQGKLRMASCYLIVIQRTAGVIAAREAATLIVQRIAQEAESNYAAVSVSPQPPPSFTPASSTGADPLSLSARTLSVPSPAAVPSLSASPSVTFHRRRKLSALETELQRFIAITRGMEAEQRQQQAEAEAAAIAAAASNQSGSVIQSGGHMQSAGMLAGASGVAVGAAPVHLSSPQPVQTPLERPGATAQDSADAAAAASEDGSCIVS